MVRVTGESWLFVTVAIVLSVLITGIIVLAWAGRVVPDALLMTLTTLSSAVVSALLLRLNVRPGSASRRGRTRTRNSNGVLDA